MKNLLKIFLIGGLGGALVVGLYEIALKTDPKVNTIIKEVPIIRRTSYNTIEESDFVTAAESTVHAVVHVKTEIESEVYATPFDYFFGDPNANSKPRIQMGSGSGVIISTDGYIVTNNHVINKAQSIKVSLNDDREYDAQIIGTDPTTDIALLKIQEEGLQYLTLSNSDEVRLGQWVLAIGNPFNLTSTVTAGIVSAKGRDINIISDRSAIESFIQTDAAVNPGNSGGALVNTKGELIGINTAISTHTGSFEGYSFAVPSNIVRKVVEDLLEFGKVQRAFIGVSISDLSPGLIEQENLEINEGVYIGGTTTDGAASEAGLQKGDVITAIDNIDIKKSSQLQEMIGRKRPGDEVQVRINRNGVIKNYNVVLRNVNGNTDLIRKGDDTFVKLLGCKLEPISSAKSSELKIDYGIEVLEVNGGIFADLKIPSGFVITSINRRKIKTIEDLNLSVKGLSKDDPVIIQGYTPTGKMKYYAFGY